MENIAGRFPGREARGCPHPFSVTADCKGVMGACSRNCGWQST